MQFPSTKHKGFISEYTGNGTHCPAAVQFFEANVPNGVDANGAPLYKIVDVATHVGFYSATNDLTVISEVVLDPGNISIASANVTLNNVSVWSANSILTQGRGDGRYVANGTLGVSVGSGLSLANGVLSSTTVNIDGGSAATTGTGSYDGGSATAN